jgi:hypothetical protein
MNYYLCECYTLVVHCNHNIAFAKTTPLVDLPRVKLAKNIARYFGRLHSLLEEEISIIDESMKSMFFSMNRKIRDAFLFLWRNQQLLQHSGFSPIPPDQFSDTVQLSSTSFNPDQSLIPSNTYFIISTLSSLNELEAASGHDTPAVAMDSQHLTVAPVTEGVERDEEEMGIISVERVEIEDDADAASSSKGYQSADAAISVGLDDELVTKSDKGQQRQYASSTRSSSAADLSDNGRRPSVSKEDSISVEEQLATIDQSSLGSADVFREPSRRRAVTRSERTPASSNLSSRKGKERASTDGGIPSRDVRKGIDVVRSGVHSKRTDSSLASVERRLPLRTRRIGALGISVSSESEDGSRKTREMMDWSADDRGSTDLDSVSALVRTNGIGVNDSHFRGIVDDLTVQSKSLDCYTSFDAEN